MNEWLIDWERAFYSSDIGIIVIASRKKSSSFDESQSINKTNNNYNKRLLNSLAVEYISIAYYNIKFNYKTTVYKNSF